MESVYTTIHVVLAASEFVFALGAVVVFLIALLFGKVSIRSIRDRRYW
jgi:hypothetical protein